MIHIEILPLKNSLSHYYYYHHYFGAPRSDHAALAGLELTMQNKLASNSYRSAYSGSQVLGLNLVFIFWIEQESECESVCASTHHSLPTEFTGQPWGVSSLIPLWGSPGGQTEVVRLGSSTFKTSSS